MLVRRRLIALCAAIALVLTGCTTRVLPQAPQPSGSVSVPAGSAHVSPGQSLNPIAGLTEMTAEQKHAELDSAFNAEWPVVAGKVTSVRLADPSQLDFVLAVAAPASSVAQWYRGVMGDRAFSLRGDATGADGTETLTFFRAGLYYVVRIASAADGGATVTCFVSQGKPASLK